VVTDHIVRAWLSAFALPLQRPWRFGDHHITERRGCLVALRDGSGRTGWGEAAPFPQLGTESVSRSRQWLQELLPELPGRTPAKVLASLPAPETAPPAARCGLECALLDLEAQRQGLPLARLLHPEAAHRVRVHAALGALEEVAPEDLSRAAADGFRCAKIKLAGGGIPDTGPLERLVRGLPEGLSLRLDANRGWDATTARSVLSRLDPSRVDLVEEPLRDGGSDRWGELQRATQIALALDESLDYANLASVLQSGAARRLILKPMRLGGLLPCLRTARLASRAGVCCLVTTSLDGALGTVAAAHLAAALDAATTPQVHGLATSALLARDLARPPRVERGWIHLPTGPGVGLPPDPDRPKE
jgi:o-succinylbenzoate synthase